MTVEVKEGQDVPKVVRACRRTGKKGELIPIFMQINRKLGYISDEAIEEFSARCTSPTVKFIPSQLSIR